MLCHSSAAPALPMPCWNDTKPCFLARSGMLDKKNNLLRCAACRNGARAMDMAGRREAKITPFNSLHPGAADSPRQKCKMPAQQC
ncbi:hypothetical protein CBM2585_A70051 [Cupriavidus taiwanensis]|nr:hypothetical protein CBM2585_A70051 [Cupriavidus taiwanensis]